MKKLRLRKLSQLTLELCGSKGQVLLPGPLSIWIPSIMMKWVQDGTQDFVFLIHFSGDSSNQWLLSITATGCAASHRINISPQCAESKKASKDLVVKTMRQGYHSVSKRSCFSELSEICLGLCRARQCMCMQLQRERINPSILCWWHRAIWHVP